jgi:hypothetical protein
MIKNKYDTSLAMKNNKAANKAGYDVIRLQSPNITQFNDDFLCGICQSKFAFADY